MNPCKGSLASAPQEAYFGNLRDTRVGGIDAGRREQPSNVRPGPSPDFVLPTFQHAWSVLAQAMELPQVTIKTLIKHMSWCQKQVHVHVGTCRSVFVRVKVLHSVAFAFIRGSTESFLCPILGLPTGPFWPQSWGLQRALLGPNPGLSSGSLVAQFWAGEHGVPTAGGLR